MRNLPTGTTHTKAPVGHEPAMRAEAGSCTPTILRHAAVRRGASLAGIVISFTLLLLYTHYLSPADFGTLVLLYVTMRLLDTLVVQGLTTAVVRAYAIDFRDNAQARREAVSTAFYYCSASALVLFGALALLAAPVSLWLFGAGGWADLLQLMLLAGFFRATQNVPRQLLRAQVDRSAYDMLKLLDFVMATGLNVYFVVFARLGLTGVVYAEVLRECLFAAVYAYQLRNQLVPRFSTQKLRSMLGHGLPRVRRGLGFLVLSTSDRYFLQSYAGGGPLGLYAFGYRMADLLGDCVVRPLLRAAPAARTHSAPGVRGDGQEILGRMLTYFVALAGAAALVLCVFAAPLLQLLAEPSFLEAVRVLPLLLLAVLFAGMYRFLLLGPHARKRAAGFPHMVEAAAVLNLFLNAVLIPAHAMLGAATATAMSHGALLLAAGWIDRRHFRIRYEPGRLLRVAAALGITFLVWRLVVPENLLGQISAGCAVLLFYPALLGLVGFYTLEELEKLRELLNRRVALGATPDLPARQRHDVQALANAAPRPAQPARSTSQPDVAEVGAARTTATPADSLVKPLSRR